jgi:type IX secretion system PorP/SprF family membrane protein
LRHLLRIFILLLPFVSFAQQDPQFSQYMMNPFIWNPSVAALKNDYVLSLHHRSQWVGYTTSNSSDNISAPSTQLFSVTAPVKKIKSGIGLSVMNDNLGPLRNMSTTLSYAYGTQLGSGKLAAGLGLGVQSMYINTDLWRPENANDPTLSVSNTGVLNKLNPNFRFGVSYATEKWMVGFATNNIFTPSYSYNSGKLTSQLDRHYYLQGSYLFPVSERVSIQPSTILKSVSGIHSSEISSLVLVGSFWTGLSYRTSDALAMLAGINLLADKSLKLGYSLDLSVKSKSAKSLSSHEVFLSYNFGSVLYNKKPIARTPRFRY